MFWILLTVVSDIFLLICAIHFSKNLYKVIKFLFLIKKEEKEEKRPKFLRSKTIVWRYINFVCGVVLAVKGLDIYLTHYVDHGVTVQVPNLNGKSLAEVGDFLKNQPFQYKIADSVFADSSGKRGVVLEQEPPAGQQVKKGRMIYITVTRAEAKSVQMPEFMDISMDLVIENLQAYGLKVSDTLLYVKDIVKDRVLGALVGDDNIKAGDPVLVTSSIKLVIGDGSKHDSEDNTTPVDSTAAK